MARGGKNNITKPSGLNVRRHRPDYQLLLMMGLLLLIGLIVLFAISPYQINRINADGGTLDQGHYMLKQSAYLAAGVCAFIAAYYTPMNVWRKIAPKVLVIALALCLLLALLGLFSAPPALCHNGACRWYNVGFGTFQPAELLKFALLIFIGSFLGKRVEQGKVNHVSDTLTPLAVVMGAVAVVVIGFQKDMGTGIAIIGSVAAMLFVSGLNKRYIFLSMAALVGLSTLFIIFSPHRIARVATFLNHSSSSDATNYHIDMASVAIGSGGLFGRGLGNGVQAFGYLPEALNDSIFAVLGETFGLLGLVAIMAIFFTLLKRIVSIIDRVVDPTMKIFVAGVFGWLGTHVVVNIGAMIGIFPLTGVTLPFLSFGGTSLLFMMAAVGIVYHISCFTTHQILTVGDTNEASRNRGRIRRPRYAGSSRYQ